MSKFDNNKIIAHLREKWGTLPCPMCKKGPWTVADTTYQLMEFNEGNLVVGGPIIPLVPVTCVNCGYTVLMNAIVSGAVRQSPPQSGKEEQK
jgi:hypothetical protein